MEECFQFIVEIERRPVMWDSRIAEHRNKILRGDSLKEVAEIFAISETEVARKLRNLKTQFAEQLKKIKKQPLSGSSGSQKTKWVYFDAMRFMEKAISNRSTVSPVR